jgi:hypothetical protein
MQHRRRRRSQLRHLVSLRCSSAMACSIASILPCIRRCSLCSCRPTAAPTAVGSSGAGGSPTPSSCTPSSGLSACFCSSEPPPPPPFGALSSQASSLAARWSNAANCLSKPAASRWPTAHMHCSDTPKTRRYDCRRARASSSLPSRSEAESAAAHRSASRPRSCALGVRMLPMGCPLPPPPLTHFSGRRRGRGAAECGATLLGCPVSGSVGRPASANSSTGGTARGAWPGPPPLPGCSCRQGADVMLCRGGGPARGHRRAHAGARRACAAAPHSIHLLLPCSSGAMLSQTGAHTSRASVLPELAAPRHRWAAVLLAGVALLLALAAWLLGAPAALPWPSSKSTNLCAMCQQ